MRPRSNAVYAPDMRVDVEQRVQVAVAELRRCSDGVIEIDMATGARVGEREMAELLDAQFHLTPAVAGVLVDARGTVAMSRKALEMTANNPVNDRTAATALIVGDPVSTLLVNFFLKFGRPPYPARAFRDPDAARRWVQKHVSSTP